MTQNIKLDEASTEWYIKHNTNKGKKLERGFLGEER